MLDKMPAFLELIKFLENEIKESVNRIKRLQEILNNDWVDEASKTSLREKIAEEKNNQIKIRQEIEETKQILESYQSLQEIN